MKLGHYSWLQSHLKSIDKHVSFNNPVPVEYTGVPSMTRSVVNLIKPILLPIDMNMNPFNRSLYQSWTKKKLSLFTIVEFTKYPNTYFNTNSPS